MGLRRAARRGRRVARGLLTRFTPGEPVAVWAGNSADWVLLEFAAGLAGLTLVTVNPAYQAEELAHVLGHSGARGVFLRGGAQAAILARRAGPAAAAAGGDHAGRVAVG